MTMRLRSKFAFPLAHLAFLLALAPVTLAHAAEQVTLKNGFSLVCVRRVEDGAKVRLYLPGTENNYLEVASGSIAAVEAVPDPPPIPGAVHPEEDVRTLLARAGSGHHIDVELLASVVHAESGGRIHAVSRTGAQGLMQLMPATARQLGVQNAFAPGENVEGGTKYLDALLTRYRDDIALALAAYNAGPGAVDRYHGVPPYRETRAYVARVIAEFNRRKAALLLRTPSTASVALLAPGTSR